MMISFIVSEFGSIHKPVAIRMEATAIKAHADRVMTTDGRRLLSAAVIIGEGGRDVVEALWTMREMIVTGRLPHRLKAEALLLIDGKPMSCSVDTERQQYDVPEKAKEWFIQLRKDKSDKGLTIRSDSQRFIFTTDDVILNSHSLRRDEIWFAEDVHIGEDHTTTLFSLAEFIENDNASFRREYRHGRYLPDMRWQCDATAPRPLNVRGKHYRFLIICEGERTEPDYFRSLAKDPRYPSVRDAIIKGLGQSTVMLVRHAAKIRRKMESEARYPFDSVWVVFDEDDNPYFNESVLLAQRLGLKAAWSNEAFELWYLLHFAYLDTAISRQAYFSKIGNILRPKLRHQRYEYHYKKNDTRFYAILQKYGDENLAKKSAARLRSRYSGNDYSRHKPCTTVDLLVNELEHPERYF